MFPAQAVSHIPAAPAAHAAGLGSAQERLSKSAFGEAFLHMQPFEFRRGCERGPLVLGV